MVHAVFGSRIHEALTLIRCTVAPISKSRVPTLDRILFSELPTPTSYAKPLSKTARRSHYGRLRIRLLDVHLLESTSRYLKIQIHKSTWEFRVGALMVLK